MIAAIILAAGESRRMGGQKLLLKWGEVSILEHIVSVFADAGVDDILVVTGSHRNEIEKLISAMKNNYPVRTVFNENFASGEMLSSIQCGLRKLMGGRAGAAMIGLGDQPQVGERTVRMVCDVFRMTGNPLVVPSYNRRRGHPWLVARELWDDLLELTPPQTPRVFLNHHSESIRYVEADDAGILADVDTPKEYRKWHP